MRYLHLKWNRFELEINWIFTYKETVLLELLDNVDFLSISGKIDIYHQITFSSFALKTALRFNLNFKIWNIRWKPACALSNFVDLTEFHSD